MAIILWETGFGKVLLVVTIVTVIVEFFTPINGSIDVMAMRLKKMTGAEKDGI